MEPADKLIESYCMLDRALYGVGLFDSGVTVLHQQRRALNLVWALTENSIVPTAIAGQVIRGPRTKVAIVGAGFAGLSVAAGLIKKDAYAKITIFEQRDTLLPLQQGSDTRWLHPHIYDWPSDGSEANSAMLPVLNWTAARASDVVVQVSTEWLEIASDRRDSLELYCNTRHLQINKTSSKRISIEWIGERRNPATGTVEVNRRDGQLGASAEFDIVIIATGFGLEKKSTLSYWRNDTIGQPNLEKSRLTFYLSGQGDGAMIDLMRLKISHYRQDRILSELFSSTETQGLLKTIKGIHASKVDNPNLNLFDAFDEMQRSCRREFQYALDLLKQRIRRDTEVILGLRVTNFADLFSSSDIRMSFQNALLAYYLYRCGAFFPTNAEEDDVVKQHSIPTERVIRRIGIDRERQIKSVLSKELCETIYPPGEAPGLERFTQSDRPAWPGGYFGYGGRAGEVGKVPIANPERRTWRKEYLPGPTKLVAATLCGSIAGLLQRQHPATDRMRITLHRAVSFGHEEVLQQCCDYFGVDVPRTEMSPSGRTFPARNATIGLAYRMRRIVRTKPNVSGAILKKAMTSLDLNIASDKMARDVNFLLAIPILEPHEIGKFIGPNPVSGVIYIDSSADNFHIDDEQLTTITRSLQEAFTGLELESRNRSNRIVNVPLSGLGFTIPPADELPLAAAPAFDIVGEHVPIPGTSQAFQLNFEYTDFVPITP